MGDAKNNMTPSPPPSGKKGGGDQSPSGLKSMGGIFKKRPSASRNFADHILAAFNEVQDAIKTKTPLSTDFEGHIADAESALLRLIDIKEYELENEKGSEGYNRLALSRLTEMSRLIEHVRFVYTKMPLDSSMVARDWMSVLDRLVRHVGEIATEYAETKH